MRKQFIASIKWNIIGSILKIFLQFSITIVLTRLLVPEDFGLLAIALSVVVFGNMINEFGLSQALIQKKEISDKDVRYVFTLQMTFAMVVMFLVYFSSHALAIYFDNDKVENILKVMSLIFIFQGFGLTSRSLMQRKLDFKTIQIIQIVSYIISYAFIGVPLAYLNYGVWSLVYAQLSQSFLTAILLYLYKRHNVIPLYIHTNKKHFVNFGLKSILNNIVNWSIINVNIFLIGHFLSVQLLGYYNRANALLGMPTGIIVGSVKGVLFSFYSKIQDNELYLKKTFLGSVTSISFIIFSLTFTMALIPDVIVRTLFGNNWLFLNEIITPLSIALAIKVLAGMGGPLVWGKNKGELEIIAQIYTLFSMLLVMIVAVQFSLVYASWGLVFVFCIRLYLVNNVVLKLLELDWMEYIRTLVKPLIFGVAVSVLVMLFNDEVSQFLDNIYIVFILDIIMAFTISLFLIYQFMKFFIQKDLLWLIEKNIDKIPFIIKKKLFDITGEN